jgi:hypothetical protein
MPKSNNLKHSYKSWTAGACPTQVAFVDEVYALCEEHYAEGGDRIVECFSPKDVIQTFKGMEDVKRYIGLQLERELNARWGDDDDAELKRHNGGAGLWK